MSTALLNLVIELHHGGEEIEDAPFTGGRTSARMFGRQ